MQKIKDSKFLKTHKERSIKTEAYGKNSEQIFPGNKKKCHTPECEGYGHIKTIVTRGHRIFAKLKHKLIKLK